MKDCTFMRSLRLALEGESHGNCYLRRQRITDERVLRSSVRIPESFQASQKNTQWTTSFGSIRNRVLKRINSGLIQHLLSSQKLSGCVILSSEKTLGGASENVRNYERAQVESRTTNSGLSLRCSATILFLACTAVIPSETMLTAILPISASG